MKTFTRTLRSLGFLFALAALISATGCGSNANPSANGPASTATNTGWIANNGGPSGNPQTFQALAGTYTGTVQKRILDANYNYQTLSQSFAITVRNDGMLTFSSNGSAANLSFSSPLTSVYSGYNSYSFQTNILRLTNSSGTPDYVTLAVDFQVVATSQGYYLDTQRSSATMLVCGTYSGSCTPQTYSGLTFNSGLSKVN